MKTKYSKRFLKEAKMLRKKYREIDQDLLKFVNALESGNIIQTNKIEGLNRLNIFKARIRNSSSTSGKSGGFRVIYYVKISEEIYFLTIYCKSNRSNISQKEILKICENENLI